MSKSTPTPFDLATNVHAKSVVELERLAHIARACESYGVDMIQRSTSFQDKKAVRGKYYQQITEEIHSRNNKEKLKQKIFEAKQNYPYCVFTERFNIFLTPMPRMSLNVSRTTRKGQGFEISFRWIEEEIASSPVERTRVRLLIGHELGHIMLHSVRDNFSPFPFSNCTQEQEREADEFSLRVVEQDQAWFCEDRDKSLCRQDREVLEGLLKEIQSERKCGKATPS